MILTIKVADFSGSGLGTNTSVGISYNGNVSGTPGFIEKTQHLPQRLQLIQDILMIVFLLLQLVEV